MKISTTLMMFHGMAHCGLGFQTVVLPQRHQRRGQRCVLKAKDADVPAIIVGGGRIGSLLASLGESTMMTRSGWPADAPTEGPIYVCVRNDALDAVIDATPIERRQDLVFLQNGMLEPYLKKKGLETASQALVYFAVAKLGDPPTDGVTDVNPEGLTTATGKWAPAFQARLAKAGLKCHVKQGTAFKSAMMEKLIWICAFMLIGTVHGCTVGEVVEKHETEFDALAVELADAGGKAIGVDLDRYPGFLDRLKAYARAVSHFPCAVKENPWRNGFFYQLTLDAIDSGKPDPCPLHTALLYKLDTPFVVF